MQGFAFIQKVFSRKATSVFVTLICIASKSLLIFFYTYTGKDKIYNLSASYNLLHGKGWTNSFYYVDNVNHEVLQPFCYWPPGYGLLFTPFAAIFKNNVYLATSLLEILAFVAFILLCRGILSTQNISRSWINFSTILLTFTTHEFIDASLGTDLLALVFLLGFFYCSLRIWNIPGKGIMRWAGIVAGICLFLAGFTRYMYVPVAIFIAIVMVLMAYWKKNKHALPACFIAAVIGICGLALSMITQNAACGSPFYTGIEEQGVFWNNLTHWHPAAVASFSDLNFLPIQLEKFSGIAFTEWLRLFNWINWAIYLWIVIAFVRFFLKHINTGASSFPLFEILGSLLSAAIIGELALLSLTNGLKYTVYGETWTFIIEGRYHAFPLVFFQLFLLKKMPGITQLTRPYHFYKVIFTLCFFLFVLNSLHQLYFTGKTALNFSAMKENSIREQDYVFFERLLKKTIHDNPGKEILVASDDKFYPLLASMLNSKGLADIESLNNRLPIVSKPALLFVIFYHGNESKYTAYLQKNDETQIKEVAGTRFYMQLLKPGAGN